MPDGVPPAVAKAFASLLPAMITISAFALVAAIFAAFGVDDIVGSFYTVVQEPFMGLANSYPSALLLAFITPFLWFFGLHGAKYGPSFDANDQCAGNRKQMSMRSQLDIAHHLS